MPKTKSSVTVLQDTSLPFVTQEIPSEQILFPFIRVGQVDIGSFKDRVFALFFLCTVIIKDTESDISKKKNRKNIDECHKSHQNIGEVPNG